MMRSCSHVELYKVLSICHQSVCQCIDFLMILSFFLSVSSIVCSFDSNLTSTRQSIKVCLHESNESYSPHSHVTGLLRLLVLRYSEFLTFMSLFSFLTLGWSSCSLIQFISVCLTWGSHTWERTRRAFLSNPRLFISVLSFELSVSDCCILFLFTHPPTPYSSSST